MKVCFETFGCRLNKAEALQQEAEYLANGWQVTKSHAEADRIIVRGCSVTARAERECSRLIAHLTRKYPHKPIDVCGCLKTEKAKPSYAAFAVAASDALPTRTARAYLKVQDGCSGQCAFCIVPSFRGKPVSIPFDEVLDRARRLVAAGYHEIVVVGCNVGLYESDGRHLPELLAALSDVGADACRIRLSSLEPGPVASAVVRTMASRANICRFLHLPVQSGSDVVLKLMRRPYSRAEVEALVEEAVALMPKLGLGCDLITGFPGESVLDFQATRTLLERLPFSNAHIFPFSERPGTVAAAMSGKISPIVRSQRAHELSRLSVGLRRKAALAFVGKTVEFVVEDEKKCVGWTGEYFRCEAVGRVPRKAMARVFVTRTSGDRLYGRLIMRGS